MQHLAPLGEQELRQMILHHPPTGNPPAPIHYTAQGTEGSTYTSKKYHYWSAGGSVSHYANYNRSPSKNYK